MPERLEAERRRIDVNPVQVVASALAAISSAFLLSTLGVAGTVIGAALASVVATVGSALYVHVVRRTGEQLRDVRAQLVPSHTGAPTADPAGIPDRPTGVADPGTPQDATIVLPVGDYDLPDPTAPADPAEPTPEPPTPRRVWLTRSVVAAVVVFVIAMAAVTVTESAIGRSFASVFGHDDKGGSTISRIVDSGPSRHDDPKPPPQPSTSPQESTAPGTDDPNATENGDENGDGSGDKGDTGTTGPETDTTPTPSPSATTDPDPDPAPAPDASEQPGTPTTRPSTAPSPTTTGGTGGTGGDQDTSGGGANDEGDDTGTGNGSGTGADARPDTRGGSDTGGDAETP